MFGYRRVWNQCPHDLKRFHTLKPNLQIILLTIFSILVGTYLSRER